MGLRRPLCNKEKAQLERGKGRSEETKKKGRVGPRKTSCYSNDSDTSYHFRCADLRNGTHFFVPIPHCTSPHTFYWAVGRHMSPKLSITRGCRSSYNTWLFGLTRVSPQRAGRSFPPFCKAHSRDWHTYRQSLYFRSPIYRMSYDNLMIILR